MRATSLLCLPLLAGCFDQMTNAEARQALEQALVSAKGEAASSEIVEISTSFTIGQAVEEAAQELQAWFESQIPCSTVSRDGATLTVDFGTLDDDCTYNGHTYAGVTTISVEATGASEVLVTHAWEGMTNGEVTLDGGAEVTWSAEGGLSRHVVHDATWSDATRTVEASGDRLQTLVDADEGIEAGIQVDGERAWFVVEGEDADSGAEWLLDVDGVQMRGQDPVPQAGSYVLTNPDGKELTLLFERIDEDTIQVTLIGLRRERVFHVTSEGAVEDEV